MALCAPCRDGRHKEHRGHDTVEHFRKGQRTGSHVIECVCTDCTRPKDWRGEPQEVPTWRPHRRMN